MSVSLFFSVFCSLFSFGRHLRTSLPAQTSCRPPRLEGQEMRKILPRSTIWQMVSSGSRRACDTCHAWPASPMSGIPAKFRKSRRRMSLPVRETTRTTFLSRNGVVWNIYDEEFSGVILFTSLNVGRSNCDRKKMSASFTDAKKWNV